jgi:hypothetical protein
MMNFRRLMELPSCRDPGRADPITFVGDAVVHDNKFGGSMSQLGLGRVKTFSCKRSELDEVATRAIFPDFDYALIAAISG